jgi:hypothetical protein
LTRPGFSPGPGQAGPVDWHPWGEGAFAKAQAENKPVLLAISAVWCSWCHEMDETTYADPDVAGFINQHFVAVRVDGDHRPDINARYNVGGWPTTAFLTGHGGLISGATYLPPDQLLAMLAEVQAAYQEQKPQLYDQSQERTRRRKEQVVRVAAGPKIPKAVVDRAGRSLAGAYDPANGGFGEAPKFSNAPVLEFLLHLARTTGEDFYRVMLEKTLDRMATGGIFDREQGGFFRHCARADWSEAQWEKLLEDNINLAQVYLDAWLFLDLDGFRRVALQTVDYVLECLLDDAVPAFHGSQGAHSEYFSLPLAERRGRPAPPADPFCYVDSNTQAVCLLLDAAWKLGRPELKDLALRVLARVDGPAQTGQLSHVYTESGPSQEPAFLSDWAHLLDALLAAHSHTSDGQYLRRAEAVARVLTDRYFDHQKGGFFDVEEDPEALGYLRLREKPLRENLAAAVGLLKLHQATRNGDYRQLAEATLSAFVDTYREHGEFAAAYGLAVDLWLNPPVEVTIEGRPGDTSTEAMLRAAARLSYPHLDLRLALDAGLEPPARAYVCLEAVCLPPVDDPKALEDAVKSTLSTGASPFENIFERFPGIH